MLEVLQFIFQDFWHWLGMAIFLIIAASSFWGFIKIIHPNIKNTIQKKAANTDLT